MNVDLTIIIDHHDSELHRISSRLLLGYIPIDVVHKASKLPRHHLCVEVARHTGGDAVLLQRPAHSFCRHGPWSGEVTEQVATGKIKGEPTKTVGISHMHGESMDLPVTTTSTSHRLTLPDPGCSIIIHCVNNYPTQSLISKPPCISKTCLWPCRR